MGIFEFLPKHGTAKQGLAAPHSQVVRQLPCCPYRRRRPCRIQECWTIKNSPVCSTLYL